MRIGIVGCGKIADQHVAAIRRIPDCQIVALCDRELLMAKQLGERFGITACFSDLQECCKRLPGCRPHHDSAAESFPARQAMSGVGKPCLPGKTFTVTAGEAESLIQLAETRNVKITAGHNLQFTLEMLEMRRLVKQGFLGGKPVHLESHCPYSLADASYVGPVLGSRNSLGPTIARAVVPQHCQPWNCQVS